MSDICSRCGKPRKATHNSWFNPLNGHRKCFTVAERRKAALDLYAARAAEAKTDIAP